MTHLRAPGRITCCRHRCHCLWLWMWLWRSVSLALSLRLTLTVDWNCDSDGGCDRDRDSHPNCDHDHDYDHDFDRYHDRNYHYTTCILRSLTFFLIFNFLPALQSADGEAEVWHPDVRFFNIMNEHGKCFLKPFFLAKIFINSASLIRKQ